MRRRTRDFGYLKLIFAFLFISVFVPNIINVLNSSATNDLGSFESGETGIKLCATIDGGFEDSLRFYVSNDQGFASDVIVDKNTCRTIKTEAATYTIRHYLPQEYSLESVTGGTVSADNTPFIATATGQYSVIYNDTYTAKKYIHSFGATTTSIAGEGGQGGGDEDPCESNLLYRHIECLAKTRNVIDSNLDFSAPINRDDPAENGVNTLAETQNNEYPVYYYRGTNVNQHVLWGGKCWTIYRTTGTGGVKIEYDWEANPIAGGGYNCEYNEQIPNSIFYDSEWNDKYEWPESDFQDWNGPNGDEGYYNEGFKTTPAFAGYKYGTTFDYAYSMLSPGSTYYFGNDVSYENGVYTLIDVVSGFPTSGSQLSADIRADHHYFCLDGSATCTSLYYYVGMNDTSPSYTNISYLDITGVANIEAAKAAMFSNNTNSQGKTVIDNWFRDYFLTKLDEVEDTQYCNDRNIVGGVLLSKDTPDTSEDDYGASLYGTSIFAGLRADELGGLDSSYRPNLGCDNSRDTFTVSSTIGNGQLTYPIALATSDERLLAGARFVDSYGQEIERIVDQGDRVSGMSYTMTPAWTTISDFNSTGGGTYFYGAADGYSFQTPQSTNYAPMLSLKYGATISGGTGSRSDPYVID